MHEEVPGVTMIKEIHGEVRTWNPDLHRQLRRVPRARRHGRLTLKRMLPSTLLRPLSSRCECPVFASPGAEHCNTSVYLTSAY